MITGWSFAAADVAAWLCSFAIIFVVRTAIWGLSPLFWALWATGVVWLIFRWASGLLPPTGLSQPEVLRRSVRTTAAAALLHIVLLAALGGWEGPRLISLGLWLFVIPSTYFFRAGVASLLYRRRSFGRPCIVIGSGEKARSAIREMLGNWELGLIPVAVFADLPDQVERKFEGVPVLGPVASVGSHNPAEKGAAAVIALSMREADRYSVEGGGWLASDLARRYQIVRVLPDLASPTVLLVDARPIGVYLSLELRYARFSTSQQIIKRLFDLAIAVPVFILALPFIAAGAIAVKIASPGPAFFSQKREGIGGDDVRIWKIRTMVPDAEKRLAEYLASNPAARFEWERTLKLRNDPRIVPVVGSFLRRTSIDELPQLWNIIRGDMSLVGPRVMPVNEVDRYSQSGRELRRDVPPGLTGLWQIMHRNNSDLHIREVADSYYVNNWSIWMDSWILLRTVRVVVGGSGAF
ncbi:exopolysaccharide biosynthesis polyprenyl glycosylphosphotransferase [Microvirga sp. 0TCS3.31]